MNSWSKGTQKQYSPHINRWFDYCARQNIDPFDSSVNQGAEFLPEYFHGGVSYSMGNTARSALSSASQQKMIHPLASMILLGGMFKQRPSLPRNAVTMM